jgi:hypothetical protein
MQKISLKLSSALHATAEQMARARNLRLEQFLIQHLDSLVAEYRLAVYRAKAREPVILPASQRAADPDLPSGRRHELSPEEVQQILHLDQDLTVLQLAVRFSTSQTNIRRILANYHNGKCHSLLAGSKSGRPAHSRPLSLTGLPLSEGSEQP